MEHAKDQILAEIISTKTHPNCQIELEVKVQPALLQEAHEKAIKEVGKEVEVDGFRKGKAPKEYVVKKFSLQIEQEAQRQLAHSTLLHLSEKKVSFPQIYSHSRISYSMKKFSINEECTITLHYETTPHIPQIDFTTFKYQEPKRHEVGKKELEEAVRQIQFYHADWKNITDRPVQEKDFLLLDIESLEKEPPEKIFNEVRFEVTPKRMAEWMRKLVLGQKLGASIEGISSPDADASDDEKKQFEPKKVRVTIKKIEEAILPELNDDFAKKVGAPTLEDFKKSVEKTLNHLADQGLEDDKHKQINQFLLSIPFDLPLSLIQGEIQSRVQIYMQQDPKFKENWDKLSNKEKEDFVQKHLQKPSEDALKLYFVASKIMEQEKINILPDEILAAVKAEHPEYANATSLDNINRDIWAKVISKLMLMKVEDYILNKAKTT